MELNPLQADVLRIIKEYTAAHGHSPSVRDIRTLLGVSSMSATQRVLLQLRELGMIEWSSGKSRTIRLRN
jgi:SOS-response transcriptional repressor LexA